MIWCHVMRFALFGAVGVLKAANGVSVGDPVFWITMIAMVVAGLLGHEEGRRDVR